MENNIEENKSKIHQKRNSISFRKSETMDSFPLKKRFSKARRESFIYSKEVQPISKIFKNDPITLELVESINLLKEIKLKKNNNKYDYEDEESNPKYITNNIVKLIKSHKGLYNFFSYYRIYDEKILYRLASIINFQQNVKNNYIWEENDNSDYIYFLLKGKLSFKKNAGTPLEKEKFTLIENNIFGMLDIIYERKRKLSCFCLTECSYLLLEKDFFKKYMEEKVNRVEIEKKSFLIKFFNSFITIPLIKLERFISNYAETIFFGKNDIIYREGDKNKCLYLVFIGEANLVKNLNKGEFFILSKFNQSIERIKERAKNLDYIHIIKDLNNNNEQNNNLDKKKNIKNLELLLNKANYRVVRNLNKGMIGGLEISSGTTKFRYSLISNSDFCTIIKINLEHLEDEHLRMLMINLLPIFINSEKKIHLQIKKIKYIDHHIVPPSCRKYKNISNLISNNNSLENNSFSDEENKNNNKLNYKSNKNTDYNFNLNISLTNNENDRTYKRIIQKIDDKFDTNEGGFIKMNNFNMSLCKQKYYIKEQLKDSRRRDIKIFNFIKKYEKDHCNDLKCSKVKMNYLLSEENIKSNDNLTKNKNIKINEKRKSKSEFKIWNFPSPRNKKIPISKGPENFKNKKNKKIKSAKITKKQYYNRVNEIFENYYNKEYLRKDYSKKEDEEDHKLVSLRLLKEEKVNSNSKNRKENILQKSGDFIKEIIIMKGKLYKEEGTNINALNNANFPKYNSSNTLSSNYNDRKCLTQFNSFNANYFCNNENEKRPQKVIKIVNNKYIRDLFYKNSEYNNILSNNYNNKNRFRNARKVLLNEIQNKNFIGNYQKNRMIFYDTGHFDMPFSSILSIKGT